MPSAAVILLSRQARRPCATTPWVAHTARAVDYLAREGYPLNSSIGLATWELITALGSRAKMRMTLFVIVNSTDHFRQVRDDTLAQFALDPERVEFVPITAKTSRDKSAAMQTRDRVILERSRLLVPVALREQGTMAERLRRPGPGQEIVDSFRCAYDENSTACAEDYSHLPLNPKIDAAADGLLFHWTRASDIAWPGERLIDYYTAILESKRYPRLALDSLRRIAVSRLVRASREHMPGRTPTVALSSLVPSRVVPLMTWRARYARMSFEPYALGIRADTAAELGVVPVQYYDKRDKQSIADRPRWQTQSRGEKSDWTVEQEYRHLSDLNLADVPAADLLLICRRPDEAASLEAASGIRTLPLFGAD